MCRLLQEVEEEEDIRVEVLAEAPRAPCTEVVAGALAGGSSLLLGRGLPTLLQAAEAVPSGAVAAGAGREAPRMLLPEERASGVAEEVGAPLTINFASGTRRSYS
jgi:hypothetical protein